MKPYADTNVLTRLYLRLRESEEILDLLDEAEARESALLPVTWLHRVEVVNAFQLYVFVGKSRGQPRVTPEQAAAAHTTFQSEVASPTYLRTAQLDLPQ